MGLLDAFRWTCRRVPGISLVLWVFICYMAFSPRIPNPFWGFSESRKAQRAQYDWTRLNSWEYFYILYSVGAHICACILFQIRLIWSIFHMTGEVRMARYEAAEVTRPYADSEVSSSVDDKQSLLSPVAGSTTSEGVQSRASTPRTGSFDDLSENVTHAIILPSYKEDMDTMRETLSVLASHVLARSSYDVCLAMEQRDPDAEASANALINIFQSSFHNMSFTLHPGDLSGEVAGKSSNVSWAARQLSHNYVDRESRANCVITVMDSDTHLSSNYFLLLSKYHREDPTRGNTLYCVPVIFDRNAQVVNPFVRAADIFWCGAGLSGLYNGSTVMIPTSVYSISMTLAGEVGGWDTGPESIGEDMHMFLKCYFKTKGQVVTKVIYSPASQSNVCSDVQGFRGIFANMYSRYRQAMRHMWGSLDSGYAVQHGIEAIFNKSEDNASDWLSSSAPEDRVPRWVDESNLKHFIPPNVYEDHPRPVRARFSKLNLVALYHRLYEAHFLPAHLTIALVSAVIYTANVTPSVTHPLMLWSLSFCGTLRIIGFAATAVFLYFYEGYHATCVKGREDEMKRAGLWEDMQNGFAHRHWRVNWSDYVALPVNGTLYGAAPAIVANIWQFWTDRLTYTVSAKPQLKRVAERVAALA